MVLACGETDAIGVLAQREVRVVVRLGVLGAGVVSQAVHLPAARRLAGDFDLVAVFDLSPRRTDQVARAFGTRAARSATEILEASDIDAVLVATSGGHVELTEAALRADKHVLAEKPLALTVEDAERLQALASSRGRVLQVGYMKMYDEAVVAAAGRRAGIGELRLVRVTVLHPADAPQVAHVRMPPFADNDPTAVDQAHAREVADTRRAIGEVPDGTARLYRSVLAGSLIHELSILRALGFELPTAFSQAEVWPGPWSDAPPSLLATAQLDAGAQLVLSWNWLPEYPEYREEVALFGRRGRLCIEMAPPYLLEERSTMRLERTSERQTQELVVRGGRDSAFVSQLERFAEAVRGDAPVWSTAAGAAQDLRCLQALVRALAERLGHSVGGEAAGEAARR